MKERIIEFLKHENKSSSQFAEEIGVQPSGISHIISGRNNPSLDFIIKMLNRYPYLSTDWLLFGKGEMLRESKNHDLFTAKSEIPAPGEVNEIARPDVNDVKPLEISQKNPDFLKNASQQSRRIIVIYADGTYKEFLPSAEDL